MTEVPPTRVPPATDSAARCPHCSRPFASSHLKRLHIGESHAEDASDTELDQYRSALDRERDELFGYQLRVVIALGLIYTMGVIALMVVLSGGI